MGGAKYIPIVFTADGQAAQKVVSGLTSAFEQLDDKAEQTSSRGLRSVFIQADLASRAMAAATREVVAAAQEYIQFNAQLANLNTILSDDSSLTTFRNGILDLDPALGHASDLTRGLYQTISSNVDATDAMQFLEDSAKAARAGLTSVNDTVSVGTTIMHSYGMKAGQVTSIYDKLFETVNVGKVEFIDLAQSVGLVSSIASKAGVSLDEMLASIATASLTNRPSIAIEGLRAAIANIISPTREARDEAQALGIQFDAQTLKAKGLVKFLLDVTEATKGDSAALNKLFGDIQAFNFVQSVTGTQAQLLESSLNRVANSAGRTAEAFEKQRQSLSAQAEEFKTSIERGLIKTFLVAEPLLTGTLSLINQYPAAFAAAAAAVASLAVAHALLNSQLIASAATRIPALLTGLQQTVQLMGLVRYAAAMTATELVAVTAGWGLLVAAIGLVVYQLTQYDTATQRSEAITLDSIKQRADSINLMRQQAEELKGLANKQSLSTSEHENLNRVIETLDPNTRTYIKTLTDEGAQVAATTRELERRLEIEKTLAGAKRTDLSAGIIERQQAIEALRKSEEEYNQAVLVNGRMAQDGLSNSLDHYSAQLEEVRTQLKEKTQAQAADIQKVEVSNRLLGDSREQYFAHEQSVGRNTRELDYLRGAFTDLFPAVQKATEAQGQNNTAVQQGTTNVDAYTEALRNAKTAQDAISAGRAKFAEAVKGITMTAPNPQDALRQYKELLATDPALAQSVTDTKRYEANQKALDAAAFPSEHKAGGSRTRLSASDREDNEIVNAVARSLKAPRPADPALAALISQAATHFNIPQGLAFAQLYTESRFSMKAESPVGAIGLGQIMPGTGAQPRFGGFSPTELRDPKKNLTAWGKYMSFLFERYGDWDLAVLAYHQGEGTVDKLVSVLTKTAGGKADVQSAARAAGVIGPKGRAYLRDIRRYDYEGGGSSSKDEYSQLVLGGQFQKDIFTGRDDLTKPQLGGQLIQLTLDKLAGLRDRFAAIFAKQRNLPLPAEQGLLADSSGGLGAENSPTQQALVDYYKELGKRDEELAGRRIFLTDYVEGRRKEVAAEYFDRETTIMIDLGGKEQELAELRRQAGDDQLSEQRRLLAAKNEEVDLTKRLVDLQDEYVNVGANAGLEQQVALYEELVALRREDVNALNSQVRSQVRLADATTVHSEQVRARVQGHLAQQKTATEAWADGITGAYDQVTSFIDKGLDRITGKLTILNELLKTFAHQLMNRVFQKFLDAMFPSKTGEGADGVSSSGGGFSLGKLFGFGGSSSGGVSVGGFSGGTFNVGGAASGARSGGFMGALRGLFGLGGGAAGSGGGAAAGPWVDPAGFAAEFGAPPSLAGAGAPSSALSGLLAGGALPAAALAAAAISVGTWTAAAQGKVSGWKALLGGGVLGWALGHFSHRDEKALKKEIMSAYQVDMRDMKPLTAIKQLGEQAFGKGHVRDHTREVIRLDQAKELISAYAEQTGQQSKLLSDRQLADPTNAANNFIRRIDGGAVPGQTRGYDHVRALLDGGEHVIDTATVTRNGGHSAFDDLREGRATVTGKTPLARVMARLRDRMAESSAAPVPVPVTRGASSSSSGRSSSGLDSETKAVLTRIAAALEGWEGDDDVSLLRRALKKDPRSAMDAVNSSLRSGHGREQLQKSVGL